MFFLLQKVQTHKYQNRQAFTDDVELLYVNSAQYNGAQSPITATAFKMLQVCKNALQEVCVLKHFIIASCNPSLLHT